MVTATKVLTALNVIVFMFQTRYPAITSAGWKVRTCVAKQERLALPSEPEKKNAVENAL